MQLITLTRVTVNYDERAVIADLSLAITSGELLVLKGRSGSGKTTILSLLGGWLTPDEGTVSYGEGITPATIAMMPQALGLMAELSIVENVAFFLRLKGAPWRTAAQRSTAVLDSLGIGELALRLPAECSLGQQQRAALARALVEQPRVMLVDEPTSHLDADATTRLVDVLRAARTTTSIVVASHDPMISAAADRVVTLST